MNKLSQQQFWDDFARRMSGPFAEVFFRLFRDVMFVTPLSRLPEDVRVVVGPIRAARQQALESLLPARIAGPRRRAYLRGLEAGANTMMVPQNPYPYRGRLWRAFEAGREAGMQWASAAR